MTRLASILFLILGLAARGSELVVIQQCNTQALRYVFIGDGYTSSERVKFLSFVSNRVNELNTQSWLCGYSNRVAVSAVLTNSPVSGVTASAPNSDTPLGGYINGRTGRHDFSKRITIITDAGLSTDTNFFVVVLNSGDYAGSGINSAATITTNATAGLMMHEIGHVLGAPFFLDPGTNSISAALGEEYTGGLDPSGPPYYANNAATLANATNQWLRFVPWVGAPVSMDGYYIPTATCNMQTLGNSFCGVCSNALATAFLAEWAGITNSGGGDTPYIPTRPSFLNFGTLRIGNP